MSAFPTRLDGLRWMNPEARIGVTLARMTPNGEIIAGSVVQVLEGWSASPPGKVYPNFDAAIDACERAAAEAI